MCIREVKYLNLFFFAKQQLSLNGSRMYFDRWNTRQLNEAILNNAFTIIKKKNGQSKILVFDSLESFKEYIYHLKCLSVCLFSVCVCFWFCKKCPIATNFQNIVKILLNKHRTESIFYCLLYFLKTVLNYAIIIYIIMSYV